MNRLRSWLLRFGGLFRKTRRERELSAELESHLQMHIEDNLRRGMNREEARREALVKLGGIEQTKQLYRERGGFPLLDALAQDLSFAARMLAKNAGFTAMTVLILSLGIGANTAIFSLLNSVLLQSIPVREPNQLVVPRWSAHSRPKDIGHGSYGDCLRTEWNENLAGSCSFSYSMFQTLRSQANSFSGFSAFAGPAQLDLSGNGLASIARAELVSGDYFQTLGVSAASGRVLDTSDDTPTAVPAAVLSYGYWRSAFGGSPSAIGKSIKLNGIAFTIVGVADPRFTRLTPGHSQDLWIPLSQMAPLRIPWGGGSGENNWSTNNWWLITIARLKPEVSRSQAQVAVSTLFRNQVIADFLLKPEANPEVVLLPAQDALTGIRGSLATPLYILMVAVGIVLLIACANVAGLLLSRAAAREKEIAVRLALGAARSRVVQQLLTESLLLAAAGAVFGVLFSYWGSRALVSFVSANSYSEMALDLSPDLRLLGFTVALTVLTAVVFGLAPAFRCTSIHVAPALKENAGSLSSKRRGGKRRFGLGSLLVVSQVALSVIVLAGAGLIVRTLANLQSVNTGFDTNNVLQFAIDPSLTGYYKDAQIRNLYRELEARFAALPGVVSASYSSDFLLDGGLWTSDVKIEGRADKSAVEVSMLAVGPDFFKTMRIPQLRGRPISPADLDSEHPVAVVNNAFVRRFIEKGDALGRHFGPEGANAPQYEIVGVVADARYSELRGDVDPTAYIPLKAKAAYFSLRTVSAPTAVLPLVRRVVSELDNNIPLFNIKTQSERINRLLFNERLLARLSGLFALLALVLACVGLYALLSYEVSRRTREIGIRSALGAQSRHVLRLVAGEGLLLAILGALSGLAVSLAVTRYLQSLLFHVRPSDPMTFACVLALLALVAFLASYLPARRAMRVDPMVALRYE
jgi:predicted permease